MLEKLKLNETNILIIIIALLFLMTMKMCRMDNTYEINRLRKQNDTILLEISEINKTNAQLKSLIEYSTNKTETTFLTYYLYKNQSETIEQLKNRLKLLKTGAGK